jgi:hypothetical protein
VANVIGGKHYLLEDGRLREGGADKLTPKAGGA